MVTNKPRLGFLGVGWIGKHRMEAIAQAGVAHIAALADASPDAARVAADSVPGAAVVDSLDALLDMDLDGVVIATPSALHAPQAIAASERGVAVFCQKPLARTAEETRQVVEAAERADRLLGVDLSYRHLFGMGRIRELRQKGNLGNVYAVDLVFHNAYGPDKAWFYDPELSGGGCVIDLGIHLVDLALWTLGWPRVVGVNSSLYAGGEPLTSDTGQENRVEDYAVAGLTLETGATVRLTCSWKLHAGRDAVIEAAFHGTSGGAALRNVGGSFYDFTAEQYTGTDRTTLSQPPEDWGGQAAIEWARRLAEGERFDLEAWRLVDVAEVLDRIYGR